MTHVFVGARGSDPRWVGRLCSAIHRFRGRPRNALAEFEDGAQVVVPTYAGGKVGATLRRI